jgi:hypothetical protein
VSVKGVSFSTVYEQLHRFVYKFLCGSEKGWQGLEAARDR